MIDGRDAAVTVSMVCGSLAVLGIAWRTVRKVRRDTPRVGRLRRQDAAALLAFVAVAVAVVYLLAVAYRAVTGQWPSRPFCPV